MSNRQDVHLVHRDQVGQVVGEPGHRDTSNVEVLRRPSDRRPSAGRSGKELDGDIDRPEKGETQAEVTLLVPPCGVLELSRCFSCESDLSAHLASSSSSR